MSVYKKNLFYFFLVFLFLINIAYSQDNSPASPSSSYKNQYQSKDEKLIENKPIVTPNNVQIVVQGNNRLDSSVIIRDSLINSNKTNPKDLSIAIKNLYKTGYYENVNIYKNDNIVFINVRENPLIDQISVEGNTEISDEIILAELESRSKNVFSADLIKNDVKKIQTIYKRSGYFLSLIHI